MAYRKFNSLTADAVLYPDSGKVINSTSAGSTGQVLQSAGSSTPPAYSTATYPSTTTVNQVLYSSSSNVVGGITAGNNGVLISSAGGVPSWLADGTTGQVLTATTGSPPTWSTIVTGVSSVTGTANQILASPTTGAVILSLIGPYTPATYTAHGVLVGEGTSSIVAVATSATSGVPLVSQGSSADPAFSTAVVAGGGTGITSTTAFAPICGGTTTTGNLQSASTGISTAGFVLTSTGASSLPTFQAVSASGAVETLTGDTGGAVSPTAGNINILATPTAGSSVSFSGSGSTLDLKTTDSGANTIIGNSAGNSSIVSNGGIQNTGMGQDCMLSLTSGKYNTGMGISLMQNVTTGSNNNGLGQSCMLHLTTGSLNTSIGDASLQNLLTGAHNSVFGYSSASAYTGAESSNLIIANSGVAAESNVLRIGTQGTGDGQQNTCYIAGIEGVSVSNKNIVTINTSTGQMGSDAQVAVAQGGTGAATLTGILTGNGTSAVTANAVTQHGVLIGGATNAASSLGVAATGTVLAGATGADPAFTATPSVTSITLGGGTALANYVEGTFTPTVKGSSTAGTASYSTQTGVYTRIGRQVFFTINLSWSGGNGTGNLQIAGLPITVGGEAAFVTTSIVYTNAVATATFFYFNPLGGGTTGALDYQVATAGTAANVAYAAAASVLYIQGWYMA